MWAQIFFQKLMSSKSWVLYPEFQYEATMWLYVWK